MCHDIMPRLTPHMRAYLIRGHGLYGWAGNMPAARAVIEASEFMLECEMQLRR